MIIKRKIQKHEKYYIYSFTAPIQLCVYVIALRCYYVHSTVAWAEPACAGHSRGSTLLCIYEITDSSDESWASSLISSGWKLCGGRCTLFPALHLDPPNMNAGKRLRCFCTCSECWRHAQPMNQSDSVFSSFIIPVSILQIQFLLYFSR